jgi:hypothetical protein
MPPRSSNLLAPANTNAKAVAKHSPFLNHHAQLNLDPFVPMIKLWIFLNVAHHVVIISLQASNSMHNAMLSKWVNVLLPCIPTPTIATNFLH